LEVENVETGSKSNRKKMPTNKIVESEDVEFDGKAGGGGANAFAD